MKLTKGELRVLLDTYLDDTCMYWSEIVEVKRLIRAGLLTRTGEDGDIKITKAGRERIRQACKGSP